MNKSPQLAARILRRLSPLRPRLAIVLGTGFDLALDELENASRIPYTKLPGFSSVGVPGHRGELTIGLWERTPVIVLRGRVHLYEGHSLASVTFAVRVLGAFGVRDLLLTNAAGGINPNYRTGDFMVFKDHINLMGANPLQGPVTGHLSRFVDMSSAYDPELRGILERAGRTSRLKMRRGVYLAVCGPSYETPAEIRAFGILGADAVGMSTVPEAIVARQCGMRIAAVSCITNQAAGLGRTPLSHAEVLRSAAGVQEKAGKMLARFARLYGLAVKGEGAKDSD
jgi:purine-nucleoside phosphorylase